MNNDIKYWVALSNHPKIGAKTLLKLYKRFDKMSQVWSALRQKIVEAGIDTVQVEAILEVVAKINPDREIEKLDKFGIKVLIFPNENYPVLLKEIADPPGILYYRGEILPDDDLAIGVVGSRKYTNYGERAVEKLVVPLAREKITIISGLALGIDTLAHRAALASGGRTLAVLGCGLDQIYPSSNIRLADQIIQGRGAVISEFPLGTPAYRGNFPMRNRIIAGLSLGTLVVEGAVDSGSLITARAALDYNREVFAVPGSIFSDTSEGPNRLIQMGAKAVLEAKDILTELNIDQTKLEKEAQIIIPDSQNEEIVLRLLDKPKLVDELIVESGLASPLVNTTLIMLEMKGVVSNLGGTRYQIRGKLKE
jgi:DNA processing protein